MIIQQLLKLCSCECATGASLRPSTITGVYGDEVPPVLIPNTEVKLIRADGTWLDTARESMSTPVSKTKHSAFAGCFCFNDDEHSFGASLSTTFLFRRRNYAPLSQAFTGGATAS